MEKVYELVELCKQRQQIFQADSFDNTCLFNAYDFDEKYQAITKQINQAAKSLNIYAISTFSFSISVAFRSLKDLKKVVGDMELSKAFQDFNNRVKYSVTLFDGELQLHCFDVEEHKKAQAI